MSILTNSEITVSMNADLDLGAGYPKVELPMWIQTQLLASDEHLFAYTIDQSKSTRQSVLELDSNLLRQACQVLGISEIHAENGFITFSGSVALDRAIKLFAQADKSILIESPFIDIGILMARESAFGRIDHLVQEPPTFDFDIVRAQNALKPDTKVILASSPNNPTGNILNRESILGLLQLSIDRDIVVIIDACFANMNPYNKMIHLLPELATSDAKWIMIWDTGKTFGLNEEKLGFIFCSRNLRNYVAASINVVQFGVSRRQKILFYNLLKSPHYKSYITELALLVRRNAETLQSRLSESRYNVLLPTAGSVMLVDITKRFHKKLDSEISHYLLSLGKVGVVEGNSFFQNNETWKHNFIRIALARSTTTIDKACDILCEMK